MVCCLSLWSQDGQPPGEIRSDLLPTNPSVKQAVSSVQIDQFLAQVTAFRAGDFSAYPSKGLGRGVLNAYALLSESDPNKTSDLAATMSAGLSSRYAAPFTLLALDRYLPKEAIIFQIRRQSIPLLSGLVNPNLFGENLPFIPHLSKMSTSDLIARDFAQMGVNASDYYFEAILLKFSPFSKTHDTEGSWVCPKAIDLWIGAGGQSAMYGDSKDAAEALAVVLLYGDGRQQAKAKELALAMVGGGQPQAEVEIKPETIADIANRYRKMNAHPRALSILKQYSPQEEKLYNTIAGEWHAILTQCGESLGEFVVYKTKMPAKNEVMEIPLAGLPEKVWLQGLLKRLEGAPTVESPGPE